ncbi:MAG: hypothetical protein WA102_13350 [Candidatus Methanoperedens sp.]
MNSTIIFYILIIAGTLTSIPGNILRKLATEHMGNLLSWNFIVSAGIYIFFGVVGAVLLLYAQRIEPSTTKFFCIVYIFLALSSILNAYINHLVLNDIWGKQVITGLALFAIGLSIAATGIYYMGK